MDSTSPPSRPRHVWGALILTPIILVSSLFFANFIWSLGSIPGPQYPYAQEMWPIQAERQALTYTATMGGFTPFEEALSHVFPGGRDAFETGLTRWLEREH